MAITMIPMPPNHCNIALHNKIDFDVLSKSSKTVAPVVVKPDIDSKKESVKDNPGVPEKKGIEPMIVSINHEIKVRRNADNISTS